MRMAKTDQAARMCSSCCRNTSAQPYRDTHIYARIKEYRWTMRSLNGALIDRLLDKHVVYQRTSDNGLQEKITTFAGLQLI